MDRIVLVVIGLRATALALLLSGNTKSSTQLYQLADLVEAGVATDAHMAEVAAKLKERSATAADFDDVLSRIEQHRGELHRD